MLRFSPEENARLCTLAKNAGLPPAVYARQRALGHAAPTRATAFTADAILHVNRAAVLCSNLAPVATELGDAAAATKLEAASAALANCLHRLTAPRHTR
jgi:hypothetical protein